ncbi:hypothetical protein JG688_00006311 [Phytophthora aleatoria]|uniref:Uncharacterized protein n=1 Tax=Phytophthora aleatoria TaxID=2496075 RepID=A0A8J5J137_9STRA|nr:hypothetical protein JG688_00006311 [Phytophthora aleatoria]
MEEAARAKLKDVARWHRLEASVGRMEVELDAKFLGATSPLLRKDCARHTVAGRRARLKVARSGGFLLGL